MSSNARRKKAKRTKPTDVPRLIIRFDELSEKSDKQIWKSISDHHFLQKIQIFFPSYGASKTIGIGSDSTFLSSVPSFTIAELCPVAFIEPTFLDSYVKRGTVYCVSAGPSVDRHNTCAVVGHKLILSICHETYGQLGLSGERCPLKGSQFYVVEINIGRSTFLQGTSEYDRAYWCLSRMQPCRFLATHFHEGSSDTVRFPTEFCKHQRTAACKTHMRPIDDDIRIPTMDEFKQAAGCEMYADLFEWLGFLHCGFLSCIRGRPPADEFPTTVRSPVECASAIGRGVVHEVREPCNRSPVHAHVHARTRSPMRAGILS